MHRVGLLYFFLTSCFECVYTNKKWQRKRNQELRKEEQTVIDKYNGLVMDLVYTYFEFLFTISSSSPYNAFFITHNVLRSHTHSLSAFLASLASNPQMSSSYINWFLCLVSSSSSVH